LYDISETDYVNADIWQELEPSRCAVELAAAAWRRKREQQRVF
jgi:hypothetical protein